MLTSNFVIFLVSLFSFNYILNAAFMDAKF
jgi:hypothetical protein